MSEFLNQSVMIDINPESESFNAVAAVAIFIVAATVVAVFESDIEMKVSHFLCRTHSELTLNRKLGGARCKNAKKHLYDALYFRKIEPDAMIASRKG